MATKKPIPPGTPTKRILNPDIHGAADSWHVRPVTESLREQERAMYSVIIGENTKADLTEICRQSNPTLSFELGISGLIEFWRLKSGGAHITDYVPQTKTAQQIQFQE